MGKFRFKRSGKSKVCARQKKRESAKTKGKVLWLKILDMCLFVGFSSPLSLHLRLLSFPEALAATSSGLALATFAIWSLIKTKENESEEKEMEERQWWG